MLVIKTAGRFLSTMPMADRRAEYGQSSAAQKAFWGIAALAAERDGLFKLDDPVSDTITEWKSDPRKSQITIRQLLSQTDGIEGASRLQRPSIRDRNAMAIRLPAIADQGRLLFMGRAICRFFPSCCAEN